jgi:hypothetical protein
MVNGEWKKMTLPDTLRLKGCPREHCNCDPAGGEGGAAHSVNGRQKGRGGWRPTTGCCLKHEPGPSN